MKKLSSLFREEIPERDLKRIEVLEEHYDIIGDGVAVAKLDRLLENPKFRESVSKLANADLLNRDDLLG